VAMVDKKRRSPSAARRKIMMPAVSTTMLPRNGTPNHTVPIKGGMSSEFARDTRD
jgi:hypothetical protein